MHWSDEAENLVKKAPFFVRRKIRQKVEEEARNSGASVVTIDHVNASRRKFLKNMENEVKGFQVETCFGSGGCPNRAVIDDSLADEIAAIPELNQMREFLKQKVKGPLKLHHEFRISISDCPNACSRPQIADIGVIGARSPEIDNMDCNACGSCRNICKEGAISYSLDGETLVDADKCVNCGACVNVCPTSALKTKQQGYRVQIGGKLGRHPQLARELGGIYSKEQLLKIIRQCVKHYMKENVEGERFGEIINRTGVNFFNSDEKNF